MSENLWDDSMQQFRERVAAATPTPGGGAVAAVTAAFAAALLRMVCGISLRSAVNSQRGSIEAIADKLQKYEEVLAQFAQDDIRVFDSYMQGRRGTPAEAQSLLLDCARVPMAGAEVVRELQLFLPEIDAACPAYARSDFATATSLLRASKESLLSNVKINLDAIDDSREKTEMQGRYDLLANSEKQSEADSLRE